MRKGTDANFKGIRVIKVIKTTLKNRAASHFFGWNKGTGMPLGAGQLTRTLLYRVGTIIKESKTLFTVYTMYT